MEILTQEFTSAKLAEMRRRQAEDFWWFWRFLWRDPDLYPPLHLPYARFLEARVLRKLVTMFRASLKSSGLKAYLAWRGLNKPNLAALLIEQKAENAEEHLQEMQRRFQVGPTAGLLQAVFEDRLPAGFKGWTDDELIFVRTNPDARPALTARGVGSRLESGHYDIVGVDDPEGAEAEIVPSMNIDSQRLIFSRMLPLFISPAKGEAIVLATPHGADPVVWKIRDIADNQAKEDPDNPMRWFYHWREVINEKGESRWPVDGKFPQYVVQSMRQEAKISSHAQDMWDKQFMLKRRSGAGVGSFKMDLIEAAFYKRRGTLIEYPAEISLSDPDAPRETRYIDLSVCQFYLHCDALHIDPRERVGRGNKGAHKWSKWALGAVAVAPDFHAFLIERWVRDAAFEEFFQELLRMYRVYCPWRWTLEATGAQRWMKPMLRILETAKYRHITSLPAMWRKGPAQRLPRPSALLELLERAVHKQVEIRGQLDMPLHHGWLHLAANQEDVLEEARVFPDPDLSTYDALDMLSQGPQVWQPPPTPEAREAMAKRRALQRLFAAEDTITGYTRPWNELPPGADLNA